MYEPKSIELTATEIFFSEQEKEEQRKKEALEKLRKYGALSSLTFSVDISPVNKELFLQPVKEIFTELRILLDLPAVENDTHFIISGQSISHVNLALESIPFTEKLQQAIAQVDQAAGLTALEYTGLYWQFLYPLYKSCERMVNILFWAKNPVAENVQWLNSYETGEVSEVSQKILQQYRQPILTMLAYTLIGYYFDAASELKNQAHSIILKSYAQLPYSLQLTLLDLMKSQEISRWASLQYPQENLTSLLEALSHYRNKDGSNVQQNEDYQNWLNLVNQILEPIAVKDETESQRKVRTDDIRIIMRDIRQTNLQEIHQANKEEYRIDPSLYSQLFKKNAQGNWVFKARQNIVGRHAVYPLKLSSNNSRPNMWVKLLPEQAGTEFGIGCLSKRLGLDGVVPGVVGNIRLNGKDTGQAVWISADAGWQIEKKHADNIKTLANAMTVNTEILAKINNASFTRAMLRVLITNPEDDKGNDYWLTPIAGSKGEYAITRIDNERAFFEVEKKDALGKISAPTILQVKSALYCLSQMTKNLDLEVLNDFAKLNMYEVLKVWLKDLRLEHKRYSKLFTKTEAEQHFHKDSENISLLAIMLPDKLMPELLGRLQLIQHIVRDVLNKGESLTGLALLQHVQPLLVRNREGSYYYAKAFQIYPHASQAAERFNYLTKEAYATASATATTSNALEKQISAKSPALAAQQSLRLERPLTVLDVLDSRTETHYSPKQAQEQLHSLVNTNASQIWHDLLTGGSLLQKQAMAAFSELPIKQRATLIIQSSKMLMKDPTIYTLEQQEIILEAIATANWQRLKLTAFSSALTPKLFEKIIKKTAESLVHLDISKCIQIRNQHITLVAKTCFLLESLDISGLQITDLNIRQPTEGFFRIEGEYLPKLTFLKMEDCPAVKSIYLTLNALTLLKMDNCSSVQSLSLNAYSLTLLKAENCLLLTKIKVFAPVTARALLTGCHSLSFIPLKSILFLTRRAGEKHSEYNDNELYETIWDKVTQVPKLKKALEDYARGKVVDVIERLPNLIVNKPSKEFFFQEAIVWSHLPIKHLQLNNNMLNNVMIGCLSHLFRYNSAIIHLDLSNNRFDSEGLTWILQTLKYNNVTELEIYNNPITYAFLEKLTQQLGSESHQKKNISIRSSVYKADYYGYKAPRVLQCQQVSLFLEEGYLGLNSMNAVPLILFSLFSGGEIRKRVMTSSLFIRERLTSIYAADPKYFLAENVFSVEGKTKLLSPKLDLPSIDDKITVLDLTNYNIDDDALKKLAISFKPYSSLKLEKLILSENMITPKGLELLAEQILPKLPHLVHLDLSKNIFDEDGLQHILKAFHRLKMPVKRLNLSGNTIGDAGMALLKEYCVHNTDLEFLGLQDTSFTEKVGYSRLLELVKKNISLLAVDVRDNLLLLPKAHKELEKYLSRNKKLQPQVQCLRKKKSHYKADFMKEAEKCIALVKEENVKNLNKTTSFLSYLEKDWEASIQFAYRNIRSELKKEGSDESHPLLIHFNEIEEKKCKLRKGYDLLLQKLQQPDIWQANRAIIRIWKPGSFENGEFVAEDNVAKNIFNAGAKDHNVGHVSLEIERQYSSFWPKKNKKKFSNPGYFFNTKIDDEQQEGPDKTRPRTADIIFVLYSLDVAALEEHFCKIREKYNYSLLPNSKRVANCASHALELLMNGGLDDLLPKSKWPAKTAEHGFAEFHPLYIASLLEAVKKIEEQRYPFTKKFDTLHKDEKALGQIRKVYKIKPDNETQQEYSKTHFFAATRLPNMKAVLAEDHWNTTTRPIYIAEETHNSTNAHELSFMKGDLLEDLTADLQDSEEDFQKKFPNPKADLDTRKPVLPGWVRQTQRRPAIAVVEADIPSLSLQKGTELKIIGKNGDLEDPQGEIICQEEVSPEKFRTYTLKYGQARLKG